MAFRIKNIGKQAIYVFGYYLAQGGTIDLQTVATNAEIVTSITTGELYDKLMGRMIVMVAPSVDIFQIGLTDDQLNRLYKAGFLQGKLGLDELKHPFKFNDDGYLFVDVHGITVEGDVIVDIRGDEPIPADRDSALAMGTEDGTVAGTVHVVHMDGYGDVIVVGPDAEGDAITGNPVHTAGMDPNGLTRQYAVDRWGNHIVVGPETVGDAANRDPVRIGGTDPGGLVTNIATNVAGDVIVVGPNADAAAAVGNSVHVAGVDPGGLTRTIATDTGGNTIVAGHDATGAAPTVSPVYTAGLNGAGNVAPFALIARTSGFEQPAITQSAQITYDTAQQIPVHNYSTARGDGTAVRLADTTITFTPSTAVTTSQLRKVIVDTGAEIRILEQGHNGVRLSLSGTTLTVAGAGVAPVPAGSTVVVTWAAQDKAYDAGVSAYKNFEVAPMDSHYSTIDMSQTAAVAGGSTYSYYIDMAGYSYLSLQYSSLVGSYTKTLTVQASLQDDGTAPGSIAAAGWYDVTASWFGGVGGATSYTAATLLEKDTPVTVKWVRVQVAVGAGANVDNTWNLWGRKKAI